MHERQLSALGLKCVLAETGLEIEASSGPTARDVLDHVRRFRPQIVLLDFRVGPEIGSGIELVAPLVSEGATVLMLTAERRRAVLAECLEAGAAGWISKDASLADVDWTLRRVLAGGSVIGQTKRAALVDALRCERESIRRAESFFSELSQRELLVLAALVDGLSADEIAQEHFVAVTTVRSQIRSVLQKLGVRSQLAAVAIAADRRELLPPRRHERIDRRRPCAEPGYLPVAVAAGTA